MKNISKKTTKRVKGSSKAKKTLGALTWGASISRACAICKQAFSVSYVSTPETNVENMIKAEKELEKQIEACKHG